MTSIKRTIGAVGASILLAAALTACGGGASGAPDDASNKDFCDAFTEEPKDADSKDTDKAADSIHDYAEKLQEVGTPEDLDGDAREGFEVYVDFLADIDGDDVKDFSDAEDSSDVFDGDDSEKVDAFIEKTLEVCTAELGGGEG